MVTVLYSVLMLDSVLLFDQEYFLFLCYIHKNIHTNFFKKKKKRKHELEILNITILAIKGFNITYISTDLVGHIMIIKLSVFCNPVRQ
jgi:O-antigen/teichoic acid export membrane protein